ncbi:30S ribosomal protein S4 [Candidatus Woesearchaeota archaeon CG_4_10_14_0_8_um_filter_47_5]|nr:MAG: 30S ribosomal protein S4 [Candidatus Woesearchaeota archaeon CG_4_10_14_0_8_um_filter_47_5]
MGDPKLPKKKYRRPTHPWQKGRIEQEKEYLNEYGLKNKKQVWKMVTILQNAKSQAKRLTIQTGPQAEKEKTQLLTKLATLGFVPENAALEDVLGLENKDVLERRLQTLVVRKNLARSMKQARQLITHGHVQINGKKITVPSYLVRSSEESSLGFSANSALADEMHPERIQPKALVPGSGEDEKPVTWEKSGPSEKKESEHKHASRKVPEKTQSSKKESHHHKKEENKDEQ